MTQVPIDDASAVAEPPVATRSTDGWFQRLYHQLAAAPAASCFAIRR